MIELGNKIKGFFKTMGNRPFGERVGDKLTSYENRQELLRIFNSGVRSKIVKYNFNGEKGKVGPMYLIGNKK